MVIIKSEEFANRNYFPHLTVVLCVPLSRAFLSFFANNFNYSRIRVARINLSNRIGCRQRNNANEEEEEKNTLFYSKVSTYNMATNRLGALLCSSRLAITVPFWVL